MPNVHANLSELFANIADAIRTADDNITGPIVADEFPTLIGNIQSGVDTTDATARREHIQDGYTAYVNGVKIEGTMKPAATDIAKGATVAGVTGTYTSDANATAAQIQSGKTAYVNGVLIKGSLKPDSEDIKFGATIAGVSGSFTQVSENAATSGDVLAGKIAYVNGAQIIGNIATVAHPKPTVTLNGSNGVVTASHVQSTGYVTGGTSTQTLELTTQGATTIYPTSVTQTAVLGGTFCTGDIKVGPSLQVVTGSVSETENTSNSTYTISTTFKPKGFVMFSETGGESITSDKVFCLYDLTASGSVTGYCTHSTSVHHGIQMLSVIFHSDVNDGYDSAIISDIINTYYGGYASNVEFNPYNVTWNDGDGTTKISILETMFMSNDAGGYQEGMATDSIFNDLTGDSTLLFDDFYSRASAYITDALISLDTNDTTFETSTASYSSTGVTITVPISTVDDRDEILNGVTCYSMKYVIWG